MNYFVLMMLMGVKSDDMKLIGVTYDDTICDFYGLVSYQKERRVFANKRSGFTPRQRISQKNIKLPQNFGTMH
jgi:hypothetical protein